MGYRIDYPANPLQDANGDPRSGAKVYVYSDGTTTPVSVFSNEACTVSAANPIVADETGLLPVRYVATTAQLTLVTKTAADVTLSTDDDQNPAVGSSGLLAAANNLSELASPSTARTNLGLGDTATVNYAGLSEDSAPAGASDFLLHYDVSAGAWKKVKHNNVRPLETIAFAVSDETTAITAGAGKVTYRMPYAFTLRSSPLGVRASLTTASSSGVVTVDINEAGTSILSTKLTIDQSEKTSTTAATPAVVSDVTLADDAEITIDIDGAGTGAAGLKVYLIGYRA